MGAGIITKIIGTPTSLQYIIGGFSNEEEKTVDHIYMPAMVKKHNSDKRHSTPTKMHKYIFQFGTKIGRVDDVTNGVVTILPGCIEKFNVIGMDETTYGVKYADGSTDTLDGDKLEAEMSIFKNANKLLNPDH